MQRIFVCYKNEDKSIEAKDTLSLCKYIRAKGYLPIAPNIYLPKFLTGEESDRGFGRSAKLSLLYMCDELWYTGDSITIEMTKDICLAMERGMRIRYIPRQQLNNFINGGIK
jgi:hypothetical protein